MHLLDFFIVFIMALFPLGIVWTLDNETTQNDAPTP